MRRTATFGEAAGVYGRAALADGDVKPATRKHQECCLRGIQRVWQGLAETPVRNLTTADCERWVALRREQVGPQRLNAELGVLRRVLDLARREGVIAVNPAASIRRIVFVNPLPAIPTPAQFSRLVSMLRVLGNRKAADFVELLAYSGMQCHEAAALTWADVDFNKGTFLVSRSERGSRDRVTRCVPLFPNLRELLVSIRKRSGKTGPGDRVLRIKQCKAALQMACRFRGLPRFSHQDLRHFFAARAIDEGIDYNIIADWLGHRDNGALVARMYGHLSLQDPERMAKRMTFAARLR